MEEPNQEQKTAVEKVDEGAQPVTTETTTEVTEPEGPEPVTDGYMAPPVEPPEAQHSQGVTSPIPLIAAGTKYAAAKVGRRDGIAVIMLSDHDLSFPIAPGQKVQVALADVGMQTAAHPIIDAFNGQREVVGASRTQVAFKDVGPDLEPVDVDGSVTVE